MPEPTDVLRQYAFHMEPVLEQGDGVWMARYPHQDWSVSAPSEQEALEGLKQEYTRRQSAGDAGFDYADEVYLRHMREPVPGVYAMDNKLYLELRSMGASQTDFERAFEEAEEKRLAGEQYTKDDFLRGRE